MIKMFSIWKIEKFIYLFAVGSNTQEPARQLAGELQGG
jgi:hypothetical protein